MSEPVFVGGVMGRSLDIERLQARIAELEGKAANQQRIDILPIGTRVRLLNGKEDEIGYAEVSFYSVFDHIQRIVYRVDGRSFCAGDIGEVLSRPARKVTLVIEEETE